MMLFKAVGLRVGSATHAYGWNHPDPYITDNYKDSPKISSGRIGIYLEILWKNRFSTMIEYSWNRRTLDFEFPARDSVGNIIGSSTATNTVSLQTFAVSEKFRVIAWSNNENEAGAYLFAGVRGNFQTSKDLEHDFTNTFENSNSVIFGLWAGVGGEFAHKRFGMKADFYAAPDLTKTINTADGWYRNIEFGIMVGIGYNKPVSY